MNISHDLKISDKLTFKSRLGRLKEINTLPLWSNDYDLLLTGGLSSSYAITEISNSYINGNFLSCICLSQIFFENTLSSNFCMQGEDETAEASFAKIIIESEAQNLISKDLAEKLDKLRKIRNSYTHFHCGLSNRSLMKRILDNSIVPEELLIKDAWFALKLISDFICNSSE